MGETSKHWKSANIVSLLQKKPKQQPQLNRVTQVTVSYRLVDHCYSQLKD